MAQYAPGIVAGKEAKSTGLTKPKHINISEPVLGDDEWQAIREPLMSGWVTQGPKVAEFEKQFAARHEVKHAIAVTSATTALHLAMIALDVKPGDEVIVPAFTWISTANVVLYCGAKPVFADIDLNTFNISPAELKKRITPRTKAIIPGHLFGLCADMDAIREVSGKIPLVEDAACASGAGYKGKPAGGLGEIGCFSFHPRKSVTTGEGGMLTTNDDKLAEKISMLRNHGASISEEQRHKGPKPYILPDFNLLGYNYRMTDLQGAVGGVQLKKLDAFIAERSKWAAFYEQELKSVRWLQTPVVPSRYSHGWQAYVTLVDKTTAPFSRNEIMEKLQGKGISTRPGTHAVHMLLFYANKFGLKPGDFPNAQKANDLSMAIPLHNRMTADDYEHVVHCMKSLDK